MNPYEGGPPLGQQSPDGDENDEGEVHDHDAVGEDPVEHEASPRERIRGGGAIRTGRAVHQVAGAIFLLGYAWWAVSLPAFSKTATMAVLLAGGAAVVWGARKDRRRRPEVELRRAAPWALLAVVGGLWQMAAYLQHPRDEHPTLSSLTNALLDSHPARSAALVLWLVATSELSRR